jgi:hypothetical protein
MRTHELYILEQPSSCSTLWIWPSWPHCRLRLNLLLVSLPEHPSCCHAQPSILLFISMGRVSHLTPSLLSGWLPTNVQVNNITTLHDTHVHIYIYITSALLFFSSSYTSSLSGRLVQTLPVWHTKCSYQCHASNWAFTKCLVIIFSSLRQIGWDHQLPIEKKLPNIYSMDLVLKNY